MLMRTSAGNEMAVEKKKLPSGARGCFAQGEGSNQKKLEGKLLRIIVYRALRQAYS